MTATIDTTNEDELTTRKRKQPFTKKGAALTASGLVVGAVLGAGGVVGYSAFVAQPSLPDAYAEAREAACKYAPNLGNYDAANLDPFFKNILAGSTGEAKERFTQTSQFAELRKVLKEAQAKSIVDDAQCGVRGGDKEHVDVVVVMSARSGSVGTQGQMVPKQVGIVATMAKVDGKWLVEKLDAPFLTQ